MEHSQAPHLQLEVDGPSVRFCQQCGRFQNLPEFDDARRSCRHSLKRHKERRRQKAEEQQCAQKKKRCTAGAAREKPADAPEPTSAKGGPPTSAAAKSGLKRCRPAGAAAATQPAPAAHSKPKRQQVEAAGHVSNATSAQAGRPVAAWPALSASSTPGQASPRWPEVPYCAVLQPSSDGSSTPFPSPVPLQHPLPLLPAMPAAQQLQPQADPQHAILHGMPAQGCVPMLAAEERAEPLAPGGCLQPPVSPERARAPLSELVEEALCILQAPEDLSFETVPSEDEMLTISLELGLDLRPAAAAARDAPKRAAAPGPAIQPLPLPVCWPPQQMPGQPQVLQQAAQLFLQPGQQWEAADAPALAAESAAEVLQVQGGLWIVCQPSPATCDVPPAPMVSPFASSCNAGWVLPTPVAEFLCATPTRLHPPHATACLPPLQAPGAHQLSAQMLLGASSTAWPDVPVGAEAAVQGASPWAAVAVPCCAATGC